MATAEKNTNISNECVDNASGSGGVIVYDDKTFPISSQQNARERTASDVGQGSYSSVRPFQPDYDENEDTAVEWDPPETDSNSLASKIETQNEISIKCVDNASGSGGVSVYDNKTFPFSSQQISIECVDNAAGFPGVVVYGTQTFPVSSQKGSVDEEAMEWEPSEVKPQPKARNASMEEETPMEID
ncbi:hypothetical protein D5F01_LYC14885 [Larimichthys crocea]|uniref:Uncharacterized protein n=1 Tax=Larimichthys crocea TaxID=215358 RepID=A0A6G0I622_LARCR|nr:hypothetical protein D5F01_LYC14885 [Larimichthys crocea]